MFQIGTFNCSATIATAVVMLKYEDENTVSGSGHSDDEYIVPELFLFLMMSLFTFYHYLLSAIIFCCFHVIGIGCTLHLPYLTSYLPTFHYLTSYLTLPYILPFVTLPCTLPYLTFCLTLRFVFHYLTLRLTLTS